MAPMPAPMAAPVMCFSLAATEPGRIARHAASVAAQISFLIFSEPKDLEPRLPGQQHPRDVPQPLLPFARHSGIADPGARPTRAPCRPTSRHRKLSQSMKPDLFRCLLRRLEGVLR